MENNESTLDLSQSPIERNTITFVNDYIEMLKLCENGDIFVKGKLIENDIEVVNALREFLEMQGYEFTKK